MGLQKLMVIKSLVENRMLTFQKGITTWQNVSKGDPLAFGKQ
jgi:hypothetical protein